MTTKSNARDPFDWTRLPARNAMWWLVIGVVAMLWWAALFPMVSVPLAIAVTVGVLVGWLWGAVIVGVLLATLTLWRAVLPKMFDRWVSRRARTRFLPWWRYSRRWARLLGACHLIITIDGDAEVPRRLNVEIGRAADRVQVRMLAGQCPADWENRTTYLARAFGAQECHATIIGPAVVELTFLQTDSRAEPNPLPATEVGHRLRQGAV
ncbi:hypothetical protein [Nocardia sp. NPDC052566]|uniref:hypothetical protein n=1 Tax=Nocardia sp. NPDC052566 TaxID=3364330 RepID=UPI0037CC608D